MIVEVLNAFFVFFTIIISVYLVRHYLFTLTVLQRAKANKPKKAPINEWYKPTVSVLVPARNEERVVGKLL